MQSEDAEEFTRALGQIGSGLWRQIALAKRLGVPKALGLTTEQWINERLGGYIRMSREDERAAVQELTTDGMSQREIAAITGLSDTTVHRRQRENASNEAKPSTNSGAIASNEALPINALAVMAADDAVRKQIEAEAAKAKRVAERAAERAAQQIEDGCKVEDLNALVEAGLKFSVIYADPPWTFEVYSGKGKSRSAEEHYDTLSLDAIKLLPIGKLAADNCALFLWCVMPQIPEALQVLQAWGFEYKTVAFVWVKTNENDKLVNLDGKGLHWGMGYWTRANAELCLLATKGAPTRLDKGVHQVVVSPVSDHSRKPDKVQQRIEQLLGEPSGSTHLELFGRRATKRWTVWGNQVSRDLFHREIPEFGGSENALRSQ